MWETQAGNGQSDELRAVLDTLVQAELARRAQARAEKDWATADEVRDRLAAAGIEVVDTADGSRWEIADERGN